MNIIDHVRKRVAQIMRVGKVTAPANETGGVQILQIVKSGLEGPQNIKSYQFYGFASSPIPNSTDAVVMNSNGDNNRGIIIATNDQTFRPLNMAVGETKIYDNAGNYVYLSGGTMIAMYAQSSITVTAPTITLNGNATLNGNFTVNGTVTATGAIVGDGISLNAHIHNGVQPGTGQTSGPQG